MNGNIFGTNQPTSPQVSMLQVQQMLKTLDPNQTPQQMLQTLANQNPQFGNLLNLLQRANGDIRSLVTNLAAAKLRRKCYRIVLPTPKHDLLLLRMLLTMQPRLNTFLVRWVVGSPGLDQGHRLRRPATKIF